MNTSKIIQTGEHKGIVYEVSFWYRESMQCKVETYSTVIEGKRGILNSYFYIHKKKHKKLFEKLNIKRRKKYGFFSTYELENKGLVEINGGITYYQKEYDQNGVLGIKIGNDYNHIWNSGVETMESVESDIKQTIDKLLEK